MNGFFVLDESSRCSCDKDLLKSRKNILLRFINGNKTLELHAVYALQQLVSELDHPIGKSANYTILYR